MGFKFILHRYIFYEILPVFLVSLFVFIFAMVSTRMLSTAQWIIEHNVSIKDIIKMLIFIQPSVIFFAMPASLLISVLVCFLRLSGDNEIIAIQSSGISLYQILPPVIFISFIALVISFFMALFLVPRANGFFKDTLFEIFQRRPGLGIKEQVFCEPFEGITFYVGNFSPDDRTMKDVFVVDRRVPEITNTVFSRSGKILMFPDRRKIVILLEDGTLSSVSPDFESIRTIEFGTYRINIDLEDIIKGVSFSSRKKTLNEMSLGELKTFMNKSKKRNVKYYEAMLEYYEKFSIPIAVFFMGIIGVPLGAQLRSSGRTIGIVVGLVVFFIYYMSLAGIRSIGETGRFPPYLGVWIPVLLLAITTCYLLIKTTRGYQFRIIERVLWYIESRKIDAEAKLITTTLQEEGKDLYIGNVRVNRFHLPGCRWAKRISPENRITFYSKEDAVRNDFEPCRVCRP
jgi:lipopolysaccharide export system permease protein